MDSCTPQNQASYLPRLTDMYRREDSVSSLQWQDLDTCYQPYVPNISFPASLPLHAPIPLPGPSSLLFSDIENINFPSFSSESPAQSAGPLAVPSISRSFLQQPQEQPEDFVQLVESTQTTFPTPSELLSELSAEPAATTVASAPEPASSNTTRKGREPKRDVKRSSLTPPAPDAITSHEKKRQYLECLEQYVLYLHEQLGLIGAEAVPLERVSTYRGLSSRSIRTLLVHMENTTKKLNMRIFAEEQRFLTLRDAYLRQESCPNLYMGGANTYGYPNTVNGMTYEST